MHEIDARHLLEHLRVQMLQAADAGRGIAQLPRFGFRQRLCADGRARAGAVLHRDGLVEPGGQPLGDQARDGVDTAAGRIGRISLIGLAG